MSTGISRDVVTYQVFTWQQCGRSNDTGRKAYCCESTELTSSPRVPWKKLSIVDRNNFNMD